MSVGIGGQLTQQREGQRLQQGRHGRQGRKLLGGKRSSEREGAESPSLSNEAAAEAIRSPFSTAFLAVRNTVGAHQLLDEWCAPLPLQFPDEAVGEAVDSFRRFFRGARLFFGWRAKGAPRRRSTLLP
jgi:hypothetical protein